MLICGLLVQISKNCSKLQILICIMSTFSENYIQSNKVWPQLQPKMWSQAILKKYKSCTILPIVNGIDSIQKCILEAVIDRQDIQLGTLSPFNQDWLSRQSMTASKMHFWRLLMDKMVQLLYFLRMASNHVLGCSWGYTWLIQKKFSENVDMIPIKICNLLQFLFTWTN